jgi:hypothetical protein
VIGSNTFITRSVPADSRVSVKAPELNIRGKAGATVEEPKGAELEGAKRDSAGRGARPN